MKKMMGLALVGALMLSGVDMAITPTAAYAYRSSQNGLTLDNKDWTWGTDRYGYAKFNGKIKNTTGRKLNYVQVTFVIFDKAGNQIGTAMANTNGLAPGATWKFSGVGFNAEGGAEARVDEISAW